MGFALRIHLICTLEEGGVSVLVCVLTIRLYAPWAHSLKEKRMEVKSLLAKARAKFNASAAEAADQDLHQSIVLQFAALAADASMADSILDSILSFIEKSTQAEIICVDREFR